jgi:hypothetical protein
MERDMKKGKLITLSLAVILGCSAVWAADAVDPKVQAKIDDSMKDVRALAADATLVAAVKEANANPTADVKAMTQEKWKASAMTDPFVRSFAKNPTAEMLKSKKTAAMSEAFVSAADGTKVAFLAKTTNWTHKGNPKHDEPMAGKTWQGPLAVDESTGVQQIQVSVPVKDGDKVIGSLVVGLDITKLKD